MDDMIDALQHRPAAGSDPEAGLKDLRERPGMLSLAASIPAAELFPMNDVAQASVSLLPGDPRPGDYGIPYQPLKAQIARMMALRGVRCRPEQIVLTTGTQPALDLLSRLLLAPGSQVMLEEILSESVRETVRRQGPEILTVSTGAETGMDVDQVESLLEAGARPAFLYAIPEGHNPLGVSLSLQQRLRIVDLARTYEVPVLEDDAYGFLTYDEPPEPPLRALDESWVLHLGSFSTLLAPALRAGWMVLPESIAPQLSSLLPGAGELDVSSFSQRTISVWLEAGYLPEHLEAVRAAYRRRRDAMLRTLQEHFPQEIRWHRPSSGLHLWVELPEGWDAEALLKTAMETEGVIFAPGAGFAEPGHPRARRCLRLSFGNNPPHRIEEGIRRLARVIKGKLRTD